MRILFLGLIVALCLIPLTPAAHAAEATPTFQLPSFDLVTWVLDWLTAAPSADAVPASPAAVETPRAESTVLGPDQVVPRIEPSWMGPIIDNCG
ncbi:MAG: hypothetical protein AAF772_02015 [Acidobacteriota bacterium]